MQKIEFFEEAPGQKSITRLLVFVVVIAGVVFSSAVLIAGLIKYLQTGEKESLGVIVAATASMLTSITAVAGGWKLMQKQEETKQLSKPDTAQSQT